MRKMIPQNLENAFVFTDEQLARLIKDEEIYVDFFKLENGNIEMCVSLEFDLEIDDFEYENESSHHADIGVELDKDFNFVAMTKSTIDVDLCMHFCEWRGDECADWEEHIITEGVENSEDFIDLNQLVDFIKKDKELLDYWNIVVAE